MNLVLGSIYCTVSFSALTSIGSDMAFLCNGHGFYILESYLYGRREISKFAFFDLNTILLLVFVHHLMKSEVDIWAHC